MALSALGGMPHVPQLLEVAVPSNSNTIAMKYYPNNSLFDHLEALQRRTGVVEGIPEALVKRFILQLLNCCANCHAMGYAHMDIKGENIFLDENFDLVLGDWGLCQRLLSSDPLQEGEFEHRGTPGYMAPELFDRSRRSGCGVGRSRYNPRKADAWSIAALAFALRFGSTPFGESGPKQGSWHHDVIAKGEREKFWAYHLAAVEGGEEVEASPATRAFFDRCFTLSVDERPLVEDLLEDNWLNTDVMSTEDCIAYMQSLQ